MMAATAPSFIFISPRPRPSSEPPSLHEAWLSAINSYFPKDERIRFSVLESKLEDIDPALAQCDCMVSPANTFGIMDGGYDYDLSKVFMGESGDIMRLSRHVQRHLHTRWGGYAPPSSCTLVPLPPDVSGPEKNPWGARLLAIVPTMRVPEDVHWNKDLVYNCMWSLLAEVSLYNRGKEEGERIERVLMTGLGTGTGQVSKKVCADQMVLATKHWLQGLPSELRWPDVIPRANEIQETFEDKTEY
ncbi:hypothetical protein NM688_g7196 [Phlebia brevispora]|uniref:Uncharacterized protein n=1 Tax=Phlebia brevispora TaxID=194682 RepID=A0ACC1S890_9APHY|nr:hypothetical protein NM688_g7196 [Phlebia brevispora]